MIYSPYNVAERELVVGSSVGMSSYISVSKNGDWCHGLGIDGESSFCRNIWKVADQWKLQYFQFCWSNEEILEVEEVTPG
jgi:hypothetical protein